QLLQAQKLEAIGRLAAGIAHEINTPTQYVGDNLMFMQTSFERLTGFVSTLCTWIEDAEREGVSRAELDEVAGRMKEENLNYLVGEVPEAAGQALEGVGRISEIVLAMKEFSHPPSKERQPTNINQCIRSTATVARNEWKYLAEMELDLAEDLPQIPCLPGEFNQTILNLIVNAAHAIDDVRKETGSHDLGTIRIRTSHDETWVTIEIEDSGAGIPHEIAERIFDPFFTTKEVGKGTGQGLAIARSCIVDKLDGEMTFESSPGEGTTFTMKLPLANVKRETEGAS
ncbi:MAG: sensor histidine kinase, partial [Gemmatimonadetes bacterium]|nr:sensor histidine kinase [Gemmatimonadota bacterium]